VPFRRQFAFLVTRELGHSALVRRSWQPAQRAMLVHSPVWELLVAEIVLPARGLQLLVLHSALVVMLVPGQQL